MKNLNEKQWHEEDGVIYFSVTSDGKTGEEWFKYFEKKNYLGRYNEPYIQKLFFSKIKPTKEITYELGVLRGKLFTNRDPTRYDILAKAASRKLTTPSIEIACLVRDKFTYGELKAMGCLGYLVIMHKPIVSEECGPLLAYIYDSDYKASFLLESSHSASAAWWDKNHDFLFVASENLPKGV